MIKIVGFILLLVFILYIAWVSARAYFEFSHINDKKLKKMGFNGNYQKYKKKIKTKKMREKIKRKRR